MMACSALLLLNACNDNEFGGRGAIEGDAISFVANLKTDAKTRTVYGEQNETTKAWPIYWVDGDKVDVFCPQAQNGAEGLNHKNKAVLTVNAPAENSNSYILTGDNQEALYWGAEYQHDFYAFYPAGNVTNWSEADGKCTITAEVPTTQIIHEEDLDEEQEDYTIACNMDYAIMATRVKTTADRTKYKPGDAEGVKSLIPLNFNPINTAVTITIEPMASENPNVYYLINSLTIANSTADGVVEKSLAGKFTYTFGSDDVKSVPTITSATMERNIQVEFEKPVRITNEKGLKVTVFLLPDADACLKVAVNGKTIPQTAGVQPKNIYLGKSSTASEKLKANAVNPVNLGNMPDEVAAVGADRWQSTVQNRAYVSQLSLPGAYDAANFNEGSRCDRAQTALGGATTAESVIPYMFNHGIRVFDLKLAWGNNKFNVVREEQLWAKETEINFAAIMQQATAWLRSHTTEFLIFMLSDYEKNDALWESHIQSEILSKFDSEDDYLIDFPADITVEQARGKVLFINCNESYLFNPGVNMSGWNRNNQAVCNMTSNDTNVSGDTFSFGTDGSVWIEDYNNPLGQTLLWSTQIKNGEVKKKKDYINTSLENAKADTDPKHWFITSSAFRYHAPGNNTHTPCSGYAQLAGSDFNPYVIDYVGKLSNSGTYEKTGIVLGAYVCTGSSDQKGQEFVNIIWDNNFKANGPMKAPQ